jgi:hypothetical protein
MIGVPRRLVSALHELASQVLDRRGVDSAPATLARDLLAGFFDLCMRAGQDGVLVELAHAHALDLADGSGLSGDPRLETGLAGLVGDRARFDPGGPRNARPAQLVGCLVATLSLEPRDPPDRSISLGDEVRRETIAALASVVDAELDAARLRPAIIAAARDRCEAGHLKAFDKMAAQLDERGARLPPQPRVPLDVVRAVQRALRDARTAIVERVANAAIDRARPVLERGSPEAAARIELPITHRLTPRDVAVRRATEVQVPAPESIVRALFASLTELVELAWTAPAAAVRAYGVSQAFAVGDLIEHPKFGRGTVRVSTAKTIEVEFEGGSHTLVHARGGAR